MYNDRHLLNELSNSFLNGKVKEKKKILWFTDTLVDLNGVSVSLQAIARKASEEGYPLYLMTSLKEEELESTSLPENVININPIYDFTLPYYKSLNIKIPSLLNILKEVYKLSPTEIYVSTPGPVGFIGIMVAQLLNVPCTSIYHTDFAEEVIKISEDERIYNIVDSYMKWFYNLSNRVLVPTHEYINILNKRGYNMASADIFRRGLDLKKYKAASLKEDYSADTINLFYAGRISKDKNLEFLFNVIHKLHKKSSYKFILNVAGNGPDYDEYKAKYSNDYINFLGRIENDKLTELYRKAHLFLFPSTTDTFGMAVLESQASGIPAIVSHIGGPKEIVQNNLTGFIVPVKENLWINKILETFTMIKKYPEKYNNIRVSARKYVQMKYDLNSVITELFNTQSTISLLSHNKSSAFGSLKDIATGLLAS
jgi:glycosyltransferase involved in cell wall biosynthesis